MMRPFRELAPLAVALLALAAPLAPVASQVTERPAAFDTAGQVLAITPPLAARLALAPPTWPVTGNFVEARLYDIGNGRFVLAVQRAGGLIERHELSATDRTALQQAVTAGIAATGTIVARDRQDEEFESASSAFVRNQTAYGLFLYAPAAAALADGAAGGAALYLATAGATFFTSLGISRSQTITRAQNHLATDGGWRGALIALGTKYALAGEDEGGSGNAAVILAGGLLGSAVGFNAGRPLTNSEANAATFGSTFSTLTAAGIIAALGGFEQTDDIAGGPLGGGDDDENQAEVAGLVAAAIAGYPLGMAYARRARYGVTAGDLTTMATGGVVGAVAAAVFLSDDADDERAAALLTAGYVTGTILTDRFFAKPYDFTEGEGRLVGLGAIAGGLAAIAIPTLAESSDGRVYTSLGAVGATLGMIITRNILGPHRVERLDSANTGRSGAAARARPSSRIDRGAKLTLHPENASLLLSRPRQMTAVPLASLRF